MLNKKMNEVDVRFPYTALWYDANPQIASTWGNNDYIDWALSVGYNSVELHCLNSVAEEILQLSINEIRAMAHIKSGHAIYNPYATREKVINGDMDPLRPSEKLARYNLMLAELKDSLDVFQKLEQAFGVEFPVVTYPCEVNGKNPYGEYSYPLLQTHPAVFNDESTADDLIKLVRSNKYKGIVWDIYHASEATSSGLRPLANWREALPKLLEADVLKEVHVQAGRIHHNDLSVPSIEWLLEMVNQKPNYNTALGQMIKLIKQYNLQIPFVVEISIDGLIKAGLIKKNFTLDEVGLLHQKLVNYIRKA